MKKILLLFIALSLVVTATILPASSVNAISCDINWGSLPKTASPPYSASSLTNIRSAAHPCYQRIVLDFAGDEIVGYDVRYVDNVYMSGSGALLPLNGGAKLQVTINAPSYDQDFNATYPKVAGDIIAINTSGYQTVQQAKFGGSFEGQTLVGVGARARLPFHVFRLEDRIVIDIAHYW